MPIAWGATGTVTAMSNTHREASDDKSADDAAFVARVEAFHAEHCVRINDPANSDAGSDDPDGLTAASVSAP